MPDEWLDMPDAVGYYFGTTIRISHNDFKWKKVEISTHE